MSPISFSIHADGTCEFDDPQTYQITAADPALTIALVFSFWQMGGPEAVPPMLMDQLEQQAKYDPAAESARAMIVERNRQLTNLFNYALEEGLLQPDEEPTGHPEGFHHD